MYSQNKVVLYVTTKKKTIILKRETKQKKKKTKYKQQISLHFKQMQPITKKQNITLLLKENIV